MTLGEIFSHPFVLGVIFFILAQGALVARSLYKISVAVTLGQSQDAHMLELIKMNAARISAIEKRELDEHGNHSN